MKITVIIGSPRGRGNCYNLAKQFEEKVKRLASFQFDYVFLNESDIKMCTGCHACIFRGESFCLLKDERDTIENKMLLSDAVIIAAPGYVMTVPAVLKNFIDRIAYNFHRPKYFKQKLFFLTAGTDYVAKSMFGYLKNLNGAGFQLIGGLAVFPELLPFSEQFREKNDRITEKAAVKFVKQMNSSKKVKAAFGDLLHIRAMRTIAALSPQKFSGDFNYYREKGWFDKKTNYFTDRKTGIIKPVLANLVESIMKKELVKMFDLKKIKDEGSN